MSMELREEAREREREREFVEQRREALVRDVRFLASRPEGRRLFRWMLRQGEIFRPDQPPGEAGAYQAGRRALALGLWHLLRRNLDGADFAAVVMPGSGGDPDDESGEWNPQAEREPTEHRSPPSTI